MYLRCNYWIERAINSLLTSFLLISEKKELVYKFFIIIIRENV